MGKKASKVLKALRVLDKFIDKMESFTPKAIKDISITVLQKQALRRAVDNEIEYNKQSPNLHGLNRECTEYRGYELKVR